MGLYAPHCSAIASLIVPLERTICQACNSIRFADKSNTTLSPYLHLVYKDWHTSDLPLFKTYRQLMMAAVPPLDMPSDAISTDKLTYFMLYHPIAHLQKTLVMQESRSILDDILSNSANYSIFEETFPHFARPEGNEPADIAPPLLHDPPTADTQTQWDGFDAWAKHKMQADVQQAIPGLLQADSAMALINAPHTHNKYRFSPENLNIGLKCQLFLPSSTIRVSASAVQN
eukprot:15336043-Ditylum_brightwellii.AAC.1